MAWSKQRSSINFVMKLCLKFFRVFWLWVKRDSAPLTWDYKKLVLKGPLAMQFASDFLSEISWRQRRWAQKGLFSLDPSWTEAKYPPMVFSATTVTWNNLSLAVWFKGLESSIKDLNVFTKILFGRVAKGLRRFLSLYKPYSGRNRGQ